jgi:hypothetical protein
MRRARTANHTPNSPWAVAAVRTHSPNNTDSIAITQIDTGVANGRLAI